MRSRNDIRASSVPFVTQMPILVDSMTYGEGRRSGQAFDSKMKSNRVNPLFNNETRVSSGTDRCAANYRRRFESVTISYTRIHAPGVLVAHHPVNQQVADAFKKLYFTKRTGVLTCEAGEARRAVYFSSGFVVSARSSREEDRLGEVMMRYGRITREQFEDASHFIKSGWRLGEILAELNIIGEEEIETFVRLQLLDIACTQLITPPKRLQFSNLSAVESSIGAPVSVADILMEAARRSPSLDKEFDALRSDTRKLGFPNDPLKRFQDVNLKPEEAFVLSRVDGTQTAKDIFTLSPLTEEMTARTLVGLLQAELIEPDGRRVEGEGASDEGADRPGRREASRDPAAGRVSRRGRRARRGRAALPGAPLTQPLGGPSRSRRARGSTRSSRHFSAERSGFTRIASGESPRQNSRRSSRTSFGASPKRTRFSPRRRAPVTRRSRTRRDSTSPRGSPLFLRGEVEAIPEETSRRPWPFTAGRSKPTRLPDFWNAIQFCHQAIDQAPERAEAYHLLGLALSKNPKWRQDAEKNLRIATNLDPWKADYFLALGSLYQEVGLHLRARKAFEQAKAVDPTAKVPEE